MNILVGVCGGIAVYKAAELVRELQRAGAEVQVAMTASAEKFVTPLTFAALSGRAVFTSVWQPDGQASSGAGAYSIEHISVAQEIDAVVIAPATANTIARLAHGIADDFLTTCYLATRAPVVIAPAMNVNMLHHPATQANLELLRARGHRIVEPDEGYLACGMTGGGRLAEVQQIAAAALEAAAGRNSAANDLTGEVVLITAGGTREPIDPVRFLGNRSSGRMGHALAEAAAQRGAKVLLVTASSLHAAPGVEVVRVSTAEQMQRAVLDLLPRATMVIGAAAVADFRAQTVASAKLRRTGGLTLELEPTEDIIRSAAEHRKPGTLVIAFAAETEDVLASARQKLARKRVDAVVANDVSSTETGFDAESNAGWFVTSDATVDLPSSTKRTMADRILDEAMKVRSRMNLARL